MQIAHYMQLNVEFYSSIAMLLHDIFATQLSFPFLTSVFFFCEKNYSDETILSENVDVEIDIQ